MLLHSQENKAFKKNMLLLNAIKSKNDAKILQTLPPLTKKDLTPKDSMGDTALHIAIRRRKYKTAEKLV